MSEEKVDVSTQTPPTKKRWPIVISAVAVLLIAGLVAFLHWHESPTFCNVICHQPMDRYVEGYYSKDDSLLASQHEQVDVTCLGCHWSQAKMMDLVHEVTMWVTDGFTDPLEDKTGIATDEFCGACHDGVTAGAKEAATEGLAIDPHNIPDFYMHESITCSSCHKVHKQSIMICAQCHDDAVVPEGWLAPATSAAKAATADDYGIYDPHALVGTEMFAGLSEFHTTAGIDGGEITCADCHGSNLAESAPTSTPDNMVCAKCHADVFTADKLPVGWSLPEDAKAATAAMGIYDPHQLVGTEMFENLTSFHATAGAKGAIACADCHDTQTFICARCHSDSYEGLVPEGWTVPDDARAALAEDYGMLDPHALITLDAFQEAAFHQGGVDGTYSCADCHATSGENVFVCAQCHASDFADLTSKLADKGWTIPEGMDVPMMGAPAEESADEGETADEAEESTETAAPAEDVTYADGTYEASGKGIGGDVPVTVTIADGKIASVEVGDNGETAGIGSKAIEQLPAAIVEANGTVGVDGVSGASVTSGAIFSAVEDALAQAA